MAATASARARKAERVRISATARSRGMPPVICLRFGRQRSTVPSWNPESGSSQHSKRRTSRSSSGGNRNRPSKHGPCSGARGCAAPRKRGRQPAPVVARSRDAPRERGLLVPRSLDHGAHIAEIKYERAGQASRRSNPLETVLGEEVQRLGSPTAPLRMRWGDIVILIGAGIEACSCNEVWEIAPTEVSAADWAGGNLQAVRAQARSGQDNASMVALRLSERTPFPASAGWRRTSMAGTTGWLSRIARKASCNDY